MLRARHSYVVDSGREKSRNYNEMTGVASYEVAWISQAAADQRAGRAGRTGPGHCYRLFSSSVYTRLFPPFAEPEMVTKPVEDVVLAMKAMGIDNVGNFPFPTPPNLTQLKSALKLLNNLSCLKGGAAGAVSGQEDEEGEITGEERRVGRTAAAGISHHHKPTHILLCDSLRSSQTWVVPSRSCR